MRTVDTMTTYTAHKMPGDRWAVRHPDGRYAYFASPDAAKTARGYLRAGHMSDRDLAWSDPRPEEMEEP